MNYSGKKVLVLGLGESGLASARWLARGGAVLRVADTRQPTELPERLAHLRECVPDVEFISGKFKPELVGEIDFIIVSPGLSELNETTDIIAAAMERQIPVWSEIELFAQALQQLRETQNYSPKIIAITGTNGKTTVTSLVGLLVAKAGKRVQVAGNISPSALDVLSQVVDENTLPDVWVLELSSFQLHRTVSLNADVATVLNVTPDHLDWHGNMDAYIADKSRIFSDKTTSVRVLNRDDSIVMQMQKPSVGQITFGQSYPRLPGEFGLQTEFGVTWLCVANAVEEDVAPGKRKLKNQVMAEVEVIVTRLMPVNALKIRGSHNAQNALAALALCRAIQLPLAPLLHGLREYQGEPHRVEFIGLINQVEYIDDSKGTNVYATVAAINGLADDLKPESSILLIAGGVGKGQNFSPLHEVVTKSVSTVFLIGQASDDIAHALKESGAVLVRCASLEQAVKEASVAARSGDMVLLSPACASFDMFKNYTHRGNVFADAVKEIGYLHGEVAL